MKTAIYARYSTSMQRIESIEDQYRVCERLAERHGFDIVAKFSDEAISGGTTQRPGYQAMLTAARQRHFDCIVAEDTSRLWRNLAEQSPRLAELSDLGVVVVTHDLDTRHESAEIMGAVGGAMASAYRKEIGRRTRRGLEGKARSGKSAGGKSYGYMSATAAGKDQRVIDPVHAAVVVRVFELYASGASARSIAATLNAEGVPSPGSHWKRDARRRDSKWLASAIHGDVNRGSGILNNDSYRGVVIWNRSHWVRSAADSANRRAVMNPRSEWIEQADESLRIVSDELWQRVKARQSHQSRELGSKVKGALRQRVRPTKYLLSGLLRCQACESNFSMSNAERYQCSSHHNGGNHACDVSLSVPRERIERVMLDCAYSELLDPKKLRQIEAQQTIPAATIDYRPMIAQLERQIANYMKAIAAGADGLADVVNALKAARSELDRLKSLNSAPRAAKRPTMESVMQRAERMRELIARGGEYAQQAMRELFPGSIWLARDPNGGHLWAYAQGAISDIRFEPGALVGPTSAFPLAHSAIVREARAGRIPKVDLIGSGGRI